ncbi:MAG: DUF2510 domain-containing protein, partial [Micrococcales bacterium]|nr:DUF2510 domain-containing protein [Micrococcales bacterium]
MSDVASAAPSAGWYDDPADPARVRWWNGTEWTDRGMTKDGASASAASLTAASDRLATVTPITAAMAPPPAGARPALALPVPADPQSDVPPTAVPTDVTGLSLPAPVGPAADSPIRQLALAPDPAEVSVAATGLPVSGEEELAALLAARKAQLGLGGGEAAPSRPAPTPPTRPAADMQMFFPGQTPTAPRANALLGLPGPEALAGLPAPGEPTPDVPLAAPPVDAQPHPAKTGREPRRRTSTAAPRGLRALLARTPVPTPVAVAPMAVPTPADTPKAVPVRADALAQTTAPAPEAATAPATAPVAAAAPASALTPASATATTLAPASAPVAITTPAPAAVPTPAAPPRTVRDVALEDAPRIPRLETGAPAPDRTTGSEGPPSGPDAVA